jgi:hypothetical protein
MSGYSRVGSDWTDMNPTMMSIREITAAKTGLLTEMSEMSIGV